MKNVTLAIDEDTLAGARAFAAKEGTTLNSIVRDYLGRLVQEERRDAESRKKLSELIDKSTGRLGPNFKWDRNSIYEERLLPGHEYPDLRRGGKTG